MVSALVLKAFLQNGTEYAIPFANFVAVALKNFPGVEPLR